MKYSLIYIFVLLFVSCSQNLQDGNDCGRARSWYYPVIPGTEEWKKLESNIEMVKACQIPENVIFCLSTEELINLCLKYPLLNDAWAFNFLDDGLDKLFNDFNGIRELYKRKDLSGNLINQYMDKIQLLSFLEDENSDLEKGQLMISISNLDALLSRVQLQDNASDDLKEILRNLVIGYEAISMLGIDNRYLLQFNFFSRANVIIKINEKYLKEIPQGKSNPVFIPQGANSETADIINKISYQLIK